MMGQIKRWFADSRSRRIALVAVGLVGIALIGLSEWLPKKTATETAQTVTANEAEAALEKRLTELLSRVDGVGACKVMVTLENGVRHLYATDRTSGENSAAESTLTVDTDDGPRGLLITDLQPSVRGVVVVCDGGGSEAVQKRVKSLIGAAFEISAHKICVVKQN